MGENPLTTFTRAGGLRKIPGIHYAEGSKTAKISRQLAWRAAVDVCKTISQLALQVIYDIAIGFLIPFFLQKSLKSGYVSYYVWSCNRSGT